MRAISARKRGQRLAAVLASAGVVSLAAIIPATAASAAPPPPAKGIDPSVAAATAGVSLFYTAADGTVWTAAAGGTPGTPTQVSNGKVASAVSAITAGTSTIVFGTGSGGAVWMATRTGGKWSNWTSIGGSVTSKPGAVFQGPNAADYAVFARGPSGAVWGRDHTTAGWGPWHNDGGNLLAGTGPAAAAISGTYLLVVGTNKQLYIAHAGVTGFTSAGGQTTVSPGLTSVPGALVGFVRGTNNVGYYHKFLSTTPGWHAMGGVFGSGLATAALGTTTYTFGLSSGTGVYRSIGTWTTYPPKLGGWVKVAG
ncbi:MAG TPA: hypothetical protein VHW06_08615 [Streptosporangiaceae bacterium]|jgi:hypothetical protein|nr:hypothetical protein [Streptosporangiaceae bacterium]